ncbi:hypothetical protein BVX93_01025 [bacterium B13(2017)]|nr:hypothetical protein BVX93_01025 [bacterium B13(2017)]
MVKAVFIEKFSKFITWPNEEKIVEQDSPIVIFVLGKNPFGGILEKVFSKRLIKNKIVNVIYAKQIEEIPECQILFISKSMKKEIKTIMTFIKDKPILTIGDTHGFCEKGVHINMFIEGKNTRFEINNESAIAAGFSFSYHLLKMGKLVGLEIE